MLILGEKYSFTNLEIQRLNKKFKNISSILCENRSSDDVILDIENILNRDKYTIILLNAKAKIEDKLIKYLTNIRYKEQFTNIRIISIENFLEEFLHKCYIPEDNSDLHYLDNIKGFTKFQYFQKRVIDFFGITILFIFSFFILQKSKKKIVEESPDGPIYFKQKRVGLKNIEFECIKFRSMKTDAEKNGIQFSSKNDNRTFPWGKHMRKRRYDELPQMLNILKGEMHLIGPRPERKYWIDDFENEIPYYNERHIVAPGITGWAQVNYPYGENIQDTKQKLMYDLYYIKHWSLWLELKIVWKTAMVVLHKKGV